MFPSEPDHIVTGRPDYMLKNNLRYRIITDHPASLKNNLRDKSSAARYAVGKYCSAAVPVGRQAEICPLADDENTGLTRFGARDYDPETGRWTSKEPLGFAASNNFYSYCDNDPINYVDPTGLISLNDVRDFSASVSSVLSFGLSDLFMGAIGKYGYYNKCSDASKYGRWAGTAIGVLAGGKGLWNLGKGLLKGLFKGAAKASTKLLNAAPARLTQQGLDHIVLRHWFTSGAKGAGKFIQNMTGKQLKSMIQTATTKGTFRINTLGRPGIIAEYNFGSVIGTNINGGPATYLRVVISPINNVITAFPF